MSDSIDMEGKFFGDECVGMPTFRIEKYTPKQGGQQIRTRVVITDDMGGEWHDYYGDEWYEDIWNEEAD